MASTELIEKCRELRKNSTKAEAILWERLRRKQLNGLKFRRQHPLGGFILDFYCADAKLGIELDGGVHKEKNQAEYDYDRALLLQDFGVEIIRFWNSEVSKDIERVLSKIQLFIESRM